MIKGTLFVRFLFFMIEEDRKGAGGNTMKKKIGVPIRVQMFGGFLVSILFIILVGSISYQKAADSLKLADHLDELSTDTKQMNQKRHKAVRAVQSIGRLSVASFKLE